jgi:hypothetical protein
MIQWAKLITSTAGETRRMAKFIVLIRFDEKDYFEFFPLQTVMKKNALTPEWPGGALGVQK